MKGLKWMIGAVVAALLGLWLVLPSSCGSRTTGTETPGLDGGGADAEESESATGVVPAAVELEVSDAEGEKVEEVEEVEAEEAAPPVPETVAQKFVAAGGQKLCLAMVFALNPDWRMDACKASTTDERKTECENQRRPLATFAEDVCKTVIEESLRLDLDPGMVLAVIERESSFGRAQWDRQDRRYEIQTDVCHMTMVKSRIVERRPGRREGTEILTWTYHTPTDIATNRQQVIVETEDDDRLVINTCAAGELGLMQTVPYELRTAGDAIGLHGTMAQRRAAATADPLLQIRLGCQAIADHRNLFPEVQRSPWWSFVGTYNTGSTNRTQKWCEYTRKLERHYLVACDLGWVQPDDVSVPILVRNVWLECAIVQTAYIAREFCDQYE